ncbi:hypothetical protein RNZ50_23950 [Paracoccaceae bacterium Fryx2]|nr:hypothetical protein [Paracoccaceae bacterium Fryx2]
MLIFHYTDIFNVPSIMRGGLLPSSPRKSAARPEGLGRPLVFFDQNNEISHVVPIRSEIIARFSVRLENLTDWEVDSLGSIVTPNPVPPSAFHDVEQYMGDGVDLKLHYNYEAIFGRAAADIGGLSAKERYVLAEWISIKHRYRAAVFWASLRRR